MNDPTTGRAASLAVAVLLPALACNHRVELPPRPRTLASSTATVVAPPARPAPGADLPQPPPTPTAAPRRPPPATHARPLDSSAPIGPPRP